MNTKFEQIIELEKNAKDILALKQKLGMRRPLVVEFCGTPKAGKTTTINALNIFLKRNDFRTVVINEMATICPIKSKTNFFFNTWTLFSSMNELVKNITIGQNQTDIILIDRSIFDALCWFNWLSLHEKSNPYINKEQYEAFVNFLIGTDMWRKLIDVVYIFKTNPNDSLKREFADLLTTREGTIMNGATLNQFNDSVDIVKNLYGNKFRKIEEYNTTNVLPSLVGFDITNTVLNNLKEILTEKIGYFLDTFKPYLKDGVNNFNLIENRSLFFLDRTIVESESYIQPIPIAVITDEKREHVLVLRKGENKTSKGSPEHNRYLLYLGGHIRKEDQMEITDSNLKIIKCALEREIKEELNETLTIKNEDPFLIYTPINAKSEKHLAVCFIVEMNLDNKRFNPTKDEFIHKHASSKSGTVMKIKEVVSMQNEFETWSLAILSKVFNTSKSLFD